MSLPIATPDCESLPAQRRWLPILLACCGFLYLSVFALPHIPHVATGDQAVYLHNAVRMLDGQLIYRDYDHFALPGTEVLYTVLFKLFGVRAWIPQAMLVLIGVLLAGLSFVISRQLLTGAAVFLPGFLFLTLPFTGYLDATHHWYSVLAATVALALLIERRTPARLWCAGISLGLGTCFNQSLVVVFMGFGLFVVWEGYRNEEPMISLLRKETCAFAGFLGIVVPFCAYFVRKVGLRQFLYHTVTFVATYYRADEANTWRIYMQGRPSLRLWTHWPDLVAWSLIHLLIPLVYILFCARYWQEARLRPDKPWERLMLVNIAGLSLFLAVASAPAWNRLYTVSLPALIMLVWLLDAPLKVERTLLRGLWGIVLILAIARPTVTQTRWRAYLDLPTGRTVFFEPVLYQATKWVHDRTQPGDYFFGDPLLCFDLRLRNPTRVAFVRPTDYTRPEEVRNVVEALEEHKVRFVGWYNGLDDPVEPAGDHLAPLRQYLQHRYRVAETFSNGDRIWERQK
jgi:hypothetical protein